MERTLNIVWDNALKYSHQSNSWKWFRDNRFIYFALLHVLYIVIEFVKSQTNAGGTVVAENFHYVFVIMSGRWDVPNGMQTNSLVRLWNEFKVSNNRMVYKSNVFVCVCVCVEEESIQIIVVMWNIKVGRITVCIQKLPVDQSNNRPCNFVLKCDFMVKLFCILAVTFLKQTIRLSFTFVTNQVF